jgi:flagellar motor switch/type III secretory pathway protein FliN
MMATLAFEPEPRMGVTRVRALRLVRPQDALLPAACAAADALRRSVATLLGRDVRAWITEPVAWEKHVHGGLLTGARVLCARGGGADAFVALRPLDAQRLLAAAFFAQDESRGQASALEERLLGRVLAAAAAACAPLCGAVSSVERVSADVATRRAAAYFEVCFLPPIRAAVGVAVADKEPAPDAEPLAFARVERLPVAARAVVTRSTVPLGALARLRPGAVLAVGTLDDLGVLRVAGRDVAFGACGVDGEQLAFRVERVAEGTHA